MATATASTAMASRRQLLRDKRRNRSRIAAALRSASRQGQFPELGFGDYFKLADGCCDAAVESNDADLDTFLNDAIGVGSGDGFTLFEAKVAEKVGGPLIDLITQLLPILLPLIIGCFG